MCMYNQERMNAEGLCLRRSCAPGIMYPVLHWFYMLGQVVFLCTV